MVAAGWIDKQIIDRVVNGSAGLMDATGKTLRLVQTWKHRLLCVCDGDWHGCTLY